MQGYHQSPTRAVVALAGGGWPAVTHDVMVCTTTRMALLPAARRTMYRLADPQYGPLDPRRRPAGSSLDRGAWNRFDLAGERTIYGASTEEGAYAELVQPLKQPAP